MMLERMPTSALGLVEFSIEQAYLALAGRPKVQRKAMGQFITPASVARFMASQLGPIGNGDRILDPAIGAATLACAVIERVIEHREADEIRVYGYEIDKSLAVAARNALSRASSVAREHGIKVHCDVKQTDYVVTQAHPEGQLCLWDQVGQANGDCHYEHIIANPPYFKLRSDDPRVKLVNGLTSGATNIYTVFMALSLKALSPLARACFIVPRSFCSGAYFSVFRREFLRKARVLGLHLFESRSDTFREGSVLQENVIIVFQGIGRDGYLTAPPVRVSSSANGAALAAQPPTRRVPIDQIVDDRNHHLFLRIPTGELDERIVRTLSQWTNSLASYGLRVSTGPVVSFRATRYLTDAEAVRAGDAAPLLLIHNVRPGQIVWPLKNARKPQGIIVSNGADSMLLPTSNYVLVRRFSAKEEARRLIAAPLLTEDFGQTRIGLENHLNFIYAKAGSMPARDAVGLAAFLNSAIADRYFRIVNGNTQVNAAELRCLPLPPPDTIAVIGDRIQRAGENDIDGLVFEVLRDAGHIDIDFPTIKETRISMGKIQEAQDVLKGLGLPPAQQNELAALTLLSLAALGENTPWSKARRQSLRIHDIRVAIRDTYGRDYAENTRESIRRQVIHQFEQGGIVVRNPDNPSLATNSPLFHYALSDVALATIQAYGSPRWQNAVQRFVSARGALLRIYQRERDQEMIPLQVADGTECRLSPGEHNVLQAAVVNDFGPRFAPGATVLYIGDTANKTLHIDANAFEILGIRVSKHDKLPDVVLYDQKREWLFLIEAVTSHGPVSPKRYLELENMLAGCSAQRIYVTAFPDFATFKSFLTEIAWETEVWLAEMPSHMIHFNGDRFLGPHTV
jgi:adenine-specific DNA-methyltransferase